MEKMLSEQEVAQVLGQSLSTTRKWRARGQYPVHMKLPNGRIVVSQRSLQSWLDTRVVQS